MTCPTSALLSSGIAVYCMVNIDGDVNVSNLLSRAFQPHFEGGLMACLQVVSRFAASPGFDLELGEVLCFNNISFVMSAYHYTICM